MTLEAIRGIAVVDIGATNSKVVLYDQDLREIDHRKTETVHRPGPPYAHLAPDGILAFVVRAINELDQTLPVDAISVSAFGATIACVGEDGDLAVPVMDYLAEPPADICERYGKIAPAFSEVFCNVAPVALTLGKQIFWLEERFPEAFSTVRSIMPWSQYIAFRLGGRRSSEISALGVFTQLLDVATGEFSSLAKARGWSRLFPPLAHAWEAIGALRPDLRNPNFRGRARVLCGIHDSNANYLRYLAAGPRRFALLSTGTMIIGFDSQADLPRLDPRKDTFAFADVFGRPIGCCRFFGGREFETLLAGAPPGAASLQDVRRIVEAGVFALPSFSDTGGPMPGTGRRGRIEGPLGASAGERASLATLYAALMMSELLDALGSASDIVVDGPFARNALFCGLLAAIRPTQAVSSSRLQEGTAAGAAVLALMSESGELPTLPLDSAFCKPAVVAGLDAYVRSWRAKASAA